VLEIDDPALMRRLAERMGAAPSLVLLRSATGMTDAPGLALLVQTVHRLGEEIGGVIDKRRFRANIYVDLGSAAGFAEDEFVAERCGSESKAVISVPSVTRAAK